MSDSTITFLILGATVAVFVCAAGLTTRAWIWSVCGVAVVTVPTAHTPVPLV